MKTIRKKTPVLELNRVYTDCDYAQTYEVSLGTQRLGHVSYERNPGGDFFITELFVNPEFADFGVETQILDALLASDEVRSVSVVVPLSSTSLYEEAGFVCDPKHVLLYKSE
jgi:hypothetical protein